MSAGHRPDRPARAPAARRFRFPGIVSDVGARLPAWPLNFAFARALSLAAPRLMSDDDLAALDGVRFRIRVLDTGMSVSMRVRARRDSCAASPEQPMSSMPPWSCARERVGTVWRPPIRTTSRGWIRGCAS